MLAKNCDIIAKKLNYFYLLDFNDQIELKNKVNDIFYTYQEVDHETLTIKPKLKNSYCHLVKLNNAYIKNKIYTSNKDNYFYINRLIDKNDWKCDVKVINFVDNYLLVDFFIN